MKHNVLYVSQVSESREGNRDRAASDFRRLPSSLPKCWLPISFVEPQQEFFMMIQVTVQSGVVQDIETSEPATVQIVDLDSQTFSTFNTVAQPIIFKADPEEPELTALPPSSA
jgi:hypothetical protein